MQAFKYIKRVQLQELNPEPISTSKQCRLRLTHQMWPILKTKEEAEGQWNYRRSFDNAI